MQAGRDLGVSCGGGIGFWGEKGETGRILLRVLQFNPGWRRSYMSLTYRRERS